MHSATPYQGRHVVLSTMHGKEVAIAPPLQEQLGLIVRLPRGINTDSLGTFTREIPRVGTMREAAIAKARMGMAATGLPIGLASEGSYGPHPLIPLASAGIELLAVVDDERGMVVCESLLDERPCFEHLEIHSDDQVEGFLRRVRFPAHELVVSAVAPRTAEPMLSKGLGTLGELWQAIRQCQAASWTGRALVETDMRAHKNPTRMAAIGRLAARLAHRLQVLCPMCQAPGFGMVDVEMGLPCEVCSAPSTLVREEVHGCGACSHREYRPRPDGLRFAEPGRCTLCNP